MSDSGEKKPDNWIGGIGRYLSLSTNMAGAVLFGYLAGRYLDKWLGTDPWLTLVMFLLGVATGFKMTYDEVFKKGNGFSGPGNQSEDDHK